MAKRKRQEGEEHEALRAGKARKQGKCSPQAAVSVQIITGSYESVLHGFTATVPSEALRSSANTQHVSAEGQEDSEEKITADNAVKFADTFLQKDHTASIRCIALSPPAFQKVYLATGSSDERIIIYNVSTTPAPANLKFPPIPTLTGRTAAPNIKNHELGQLLNHSATITALHFPNRTKLLSAADDNSVAITRLRDMTAISTLKAPIPKPLGRPSGDTAAPGEVPTGINDFALHPDMKAMISISKGERCMRLWNLTTGKKGGVLNFDREMLKQVGETKWGGEARKVLWEKEEEFVVGFERGAIVFGLDSKPRGVILPTPRSKIHQMRYVQGLKENILAVSTEDGRVLFYSTTSTLSTGDGENASPIPECTVIAQMGGAAAGIQGRVKDFEIVRAKSRSEGGGDDVPVIITASSDGAIRLWALKLQDFDQKAAQPDAHGQNGQTNGGSAALDDTKDLARQVGRLIGTCETGNRILCMVAFVMDLAADVGAEEEGDEAGAVAEQEQDSEGSSDSG